MGIVVFKDPNQLRSLIDGIHDRWFDPAEIVFSKERATITIPFVDRTGSPFASRSTQRSESVRPFGLLTICHVSDYKIRDTEKVGLYDFNRFSYDAQSGRLRMLTGIPIEIEIIVTQFTLAFEEFPKESTDTTTA